MPKETIDFSFDTRVAEQYDEIRAHPPGVAAEIGQIIAREAGQNALLLEPGVGTGRIALPVIAAGCDVVGVDLSKFMLRALLEQSHAGPGQLHLLHGDISRLPFRPAVFDAVLCVHVLHLIPDWKQLLSHLLMLLKPDGKIILGRDWVDPESFAGQIRNEFRCAVVELSETIVAPPGASAFVNTLVEQGAVAEKAGTETTASEWETDITPRQVLDAIRSKDDAESWVLPDELLARVMQRLDNFALETWQDIDQSRSVKRRFVYSVLHAPQA